MKLKLKLTLLTLILGLIFIMIPAVYGTADIQAQTNEKISVSFSNLPLQKAISRIEGLCSYTFFYDASTIDLTKRVSLKAEGLDVRTAVSGLLEGTGISFDISNKQIVLILADDLENRPQSREQHMVSGTVTDENGIPVTGAIVMVKGTRNYATTDIEGCYSLEVSKGTLLEFSYMGYESIYIELGERTVMDVTLRQSALNLDEIIVIGYGSQKRKAVTSSIQNVRSEDFNVGANLSPMELIQGKVAGLQISKGSSDPNETPTFMLRGVSSINGSQSPLIIIDGVPGASLSVLANEDIETMDVLKDGSAAAIYGTRGTNGVIIITTKRGKAQTAKIEYSSYVSIDAVARMPKVLSADKYRDMIAGSVNDYGYNTDWLSETLENGYPITHNHNLSLTGGTEKNNYRMSLNYRKAGALVRNIDKPEFGARINVNHKGLDDKLLVTANLAARMHTEHAADYGAFEKAITMNPTAPVYDPDDPSQFFEPGGGEYNPIAVMEQQHREYKSTQLSGDVHAVLDLWEGLSATAMYAYKSSSSSTKEYDDINSYHSVKKSWNGRASQQQHTTWDQLLDISLRYRQAFMKHNLDAIVGYSYDESNYESLSAENYGFLTDGFLWNNLSQGTGLLPASLNRASMDSNKSQSKLIAFFGRINYDFNDKYLIQLSARYEGSTKFGINNKWGFFPAVSAGWRISRESFMENITWIDDLKLRAGYGVTGNQGFSSYQSQSTITAIDGDNFGGVFYDAATGKWVQGYGPGKNSNPDLRWEKKHEYNVGIDFTLFKGRLSGSVDGYIRKTVDLLYNNAAATPPMIYPEIFSNIGSMTNQGLEISIYSIPVRTKEFTWETSMVFSIFTNKLNSLFNEYSNMSYLDLEKISNIAYTFRLEEGMPVSQYYGYRFAELTNEGKWLFYNKNGEKVNANDVTDNDKTYLGNGLPRMNIGWTTTLKYKNWNLSIFFRGDFLYKILNEKDLFYGNQYMLPVNVLESAVTRHKNLNDAAKYSDYYLERGDYVKLDNLTLSYRFQVKNVRYLQALKLYVNCKNLFCITGYTGIDPELSCDPLAWGVDSKSFYPRTRSFSLGANIIF